MCIRDRCNIQEKGAFNIYNWSYETLLRNFWRTLNQQFRSHTKLSFVIEVNCNYARQCKDLIERLLKNNFRFICGSPLYRFFLPFHRQRVTVGSRKSEGSCYAYTKERSCQRLATRAGETISSANQNTIIQLGSSFRHMTAVVVRDI